MLQNYNIYTKQLLSAQEIPGLRSKVLEYFKQCHADASLLFTYQGCKWASIGFSTANDLAKHQVIHGPSFICNVPTCEYAIIGFRTSAGLNQHTRKYHVTEGGHVKPRTLRRTTDRISATRSLIPPLPQGVSESHEGAQTLQQQETSFHPNLQASSQMQAPQQQPPNGQQNRQQQIPLQYPATMDIVAQEQIMIAQKNIANAPEEIKNQIMAQFNSLEPQEQAAVRAKFGDPFLATSYKRRRNETN
jgi:hypothetical protein